MQGRRAHILIVLLLMGWSAFVQAALIARATVPGLDAVRFAATARGIAENGLRLTIDSQQEQPLFGIWVWVVHAALEKMGGDFPAIWAVSAQCAAAIPLVLALLPLYAASCRLYGPAAAAVGCLFFSVLPEIARIGPDGVSDSTHLLFYATALAAVVFYLTRQHRGAMSPAQDGVRNATPPSGPAASPLWLIAAGAATAGGLLVRSEILALPFTLALAAGVGQCTARRRRWNQFALAAGAYVLGFAVIAGPYLAALGVWSPRMAVRYLLAQPRPGAVLWGTTHTPAAREPLIAALPDGQPLAFTPRDAATSTRIRGVLSAVGRFGGELAKAYWYWIGLLAIYAVWRVRRRQSAEVDRFVQVFVVGYALLVMAYGIREGYMGSRHLLPLVMATVGCAGWGALDLARRLSARHAAAAGALLIVVALAGCLGKAVKPTQFNAAAHRQAADWLAHEAPLAGAVIDTHGWAGLLSGRKTHLYFEGWKALLDPAVRYIVIEEEELDFGGNRSRTLQQLLRAAGEPAAQFAGPASPHRNRNVAVYRWDVQRLSAQAADSRGIHARILADLHAANGGGL